jgi:glycosyltransferase involved in cell wall biosynthesis
MPGGHSRERRTHGGERAVHVCLVATNRFPVNPPFAGGLEAHTWQLATGLLRAGHRVTLVGRGGPSGCEHLPFRSGWEPSELARRDVSAAPADVMADHHAYLHAMLDLAERVDVDVIHNNAVHHLPLAMSRIMRAPMLTTLHTPPTPWLESAVQGPVRTGYVSVSRFNATAWKPVVGCTPVVHNGVDTTVWRDADGPKRGAVWFGRIVAEKAPHLAIEAARQAGVELVVAGPVHDRSYFDAEIAPRLGAGARYMGHLDTPRLAALVAASEVTLVTPAWPEPFGLVLAESIACGTPVAAFDRGAVREVLDEATGVVVPAGDVAALASAIPVAARLDRVACRRRATTCFSLEAMLGAYERLLVHATR